MKIFFRCFSVGTIQNTNGEGWLSKFLMVRKIDPGHDSHSRLLSASEMIYEMQSKSFYLFKVILILRKFFAPSFKL